VVRRVARYSSAWRLDPGLRRGGIWFAGALLLAVVLLGVITAPPTMPPYAAVRATWRPSEAWLYDRNGVLLDSSRVDFQRRRSAGPRWPTSLP
jgi:penicillin-binding protein 1C